MDRDMKPTRLSSSGRAVIAATVMGFSSMTDAVAQVSSGSDCAANAISARGELSRYLWLAKTKARANWRSRVRATTGLGPDYATWSRAREATETCTSGARGTICVVSGIPCRR